MESTLKRTWAEIDLDALAHNYQTLRRRTGTRFVGVVKADAYGHGSVQVSRVLEELGADYLAVSSLDEAMELRAGGITMPILILGHTPREQVKNLIDLHITQAVSCQAKALEYSQEAVRCGGELTVHIKVDTGMSRLGYLVSGGHFGTGTADICAACGLPGLRAEGIFTHFAVADEPDADSAAYTPAGWWTRWSGSGDSASPSVTVPTPALWRPIRRRIWTWCAPASCCTAAAIWRRGWDCVR